VHLGSDAGAEPGTILGILGFLQVLLGVLSPVVYQPLYAATVAWMPAFAFYVRELSPFPFMLPYFHQLYFFAV